MRADTVVTRYQYTPAALALYRDLIYGLDPQQAEALVTTAGQIAAQDDRPQICRGDFEAARERVAA